MATPFALVVIAVFATDVVFAVDSVPAVYGITGDPFLVFATNAFALLGLRALYFVLEGALSKLVHLGYGLAAILAFIGRSEEHTSELQSLMRTSYATFCLKKKRKKKAHTNIY